MYNILSAILFLSAIAVMWTVVRGASKQSPDLLSMRNLFLAGLIVFQFTSGIVAFLLPDLMNPYAIPDRRGPGVIFTILLLAFTLSFFLIYKSGFIADRIVGLTKQRSLNTSWPNLLILSIALFISGALCRLVFIHIPGVGVYALQIGASFFALSAGLAAWAWIPRLFNPIPMLVSVFVILGGLAVLFTDSFGRRDMLGIALGFVWGAYYSSWRYMSYRKLVVRFSLMSIIGILFLSAYTSTRYNFGIKMASLGDRVRALADADLVQGTSDLFSGQNAATYSMYFVYTRPDMMEYDTLHSAKLLFTLPIPRKYWAGKPDALALTSVKEINDAGRPKGWNIGPGLVGHFINDNPFIAFPLYTVVLAVFFRFCDGMLKRHCLDPFIVLPMGVALGQVIAIPRGELGNFFAKTLFYILGSWIIMQIVARILQLFSPGSSMLASDSAEGGWDEGDGYSESDSDPDSDSGLYDGYEEYGSTEQDDSAYSY